MAADSMFFQSVLPEDRLQKGRVMASHVCFELSGKRGYVTGAGSGLGRAIALGLAEAGAAVVASDINLATAEEVTKEIQAQGGRAMALCTDISKKAEVEELVRGTVDQFG